MMLKLKLPYFGHLMRRVDSLEKTLMMGESGGRRRKGWTRMRWLDGITDSMDMRLSEVRKMVMDREAWRAAINGVAKIRTRLSNWTELSWRKLGLERGLKKEDALKAFQQQRIAGLKVKQWESVRHILGGRVNGSFWLSLWVRIGKSSSGGPILRNWMSGFYWLECWVAVKDFLSRIIMRCKQGGGKFKLVVMWEMYWRSMDGGWGQRLECGLP